MDAVIFGAGVAGLTVAVALHAGGRTCRVYERGRAGRGAGMGFILSPDVVSDLARCGAELTCGAAGVVLDQFRHYRPDGTLRSTRPLPPGWRGIRRADVISALLARLTPQHVVPGAELAKLTLAPEGTVAEARLASGEPVHADLYVAADGAGSLARRTLFPTWPQRRARVLELVAVADDPQLSAWAGADFHKFSSPGLAVGVVPVGNGAVVWFIQFDSQRSPLGPEPTISRSALAWKLVGDWASPVPELLRATNFARTYIWQPIDSDLLPRFHSGNLVLVGDAAHPLLPFTSQGVAAAVAGARDLTTALDTADTPEIALRTYGAAARARCAPYVGQGRKLSEQFLGGDATGESVPLAM